MDSALLTCVCENLMYDKLTPYQLQMYQMCVLTFYLCSCMGQGDGGLHVCMTVHQGRAHAM